MMTPLNKSLHIGPCADGFDIYASVGFVAYKAFDIKFVGFILGVSPESNPLNLTPDAYAISNGFSRKHRLILGYDKLQNSFTYK